MLYQQEKNIKIKQKTFVLLLTKCRHFLGTTGSCAKSAKNVYVSSTYLNKSIQASIIAFKQFNQKLQN